MNPYSEIKQISLEDFKNIDINKILYVQLDTGEILMLDHSSNNNNNQNLTQETEKTEQKDYTLQNEGNKGSIYLNKPKSSKKVNKRIKLIKEFKSISDLTMEQKLNFYDKISKRAKYWENESYDASRSHFQEQRLKKQNKYFNYNYINNYKPLPKEYINTEEYNNNDNYDYDYNNMNYNNQIDPFMDPNYLYQLALGPFYSLYSSSQQAQNNSNNQYKENIQNNNYSNEENYYNNYYQQQMDPYYYGFQTNISENKNNEK